MENNVEEIMKKYKEGLEEIDKKYEVSPIKENYTNELEKLEDEIQRRKEVIAELEFEGETINEDMIIKVKEKLKEAMEEKKKIESKYESALLLRNKEVLEKNKLKNEIVELESGRKVKMTEKDELDKAKLKNEAIKRLTIESRKISEDLLNKQKELENNRKKWREFKFEYDKDEDGNILKAEPINLDEQTRINKEYNKINQNIVELNKMQKECDKYLSELKSPTKQAKDFMQAWNDMAKEEKQGKAQQAPVQQVPTQQAPEQQEPVKPEAPKQDEEKNIVSNSKNNVKSIKVDASKGKAYVVYSHDQSKEEEISIEEAIQKKKEIYDKSKLKEIMNQKGYSSRFKQFILKRKVNPIIVKAIGKNEKQLEEYIESLIDKTQEFPFDYRHDLEKSALPTKEHRFMNRIALAESKIKDNIVKGADKFYTIKNLFAKAKNKIKMIGNKEVPALGEGEKTSKPKENKFKQTIKDMSKTNDDINKIIEEKIKATGEKIEAKYNDLTEEQKKAIEKYSTKNDNDIEALQRLGLDHSCAYGIIEKYGNQTSKNKEDKTKGTEKGD